VVELSCRRSYRTGGRDASTRNFYLRKGDTVGTHIANFYADGDGLIVFSKRLVPVVQ